MRVEQEERARERATPQLETRPRRVAVEHGLCETEAIVASLRDRELPLGLVEPAELDERDRAVEAQPGRPEHVVGCVERLDRARDRVDGLSHVPRSQCDHETQVLAPRRIDPGEIRQRAVELPTRRGQAPGVEQRRGMRDTREPAKPSVVRSLRRLDRRTQQGNRPTRCSEPGMRIALRAKRGGKRAEVTAGARERLGPEAVPERLTGVGLHAVIGRFGADQRLRWIRRYQWGRRMHHLPRTGGWHSR